MSAAGGTEPEDDPADAVEIPVTGELDLHTFRPSDLGVLLPEYVREAKLRGLQQIRVIHGKGTGALRSGVHTLLDRLKEKGEVSAWQWPAPDAAGGWGATLVWLSQGG